MTSGANSATRFGAPATRADTIMARLDQLGAISSEEGALTRLYLTETHKTAAALVAGWMQEAGMATRVDPLGTVVGRHAGAGADAKVLIVGSHIDTVRNAGRYDGCLGVVMAIEAVAALAERGDRLPFAIEVVAFGDEEGVRFPEALSGSRALAGRFDPVALEAADEEGTILRDALRAFGCDPAQIPSAARTAADTLGYLEVHIEQGPVLEAEDLPVGVVTAIAGATRLRVVVTGVAGHAGTVPMRLRKDAVAAAAEMAVALERLALDTRDLVATIGRVEALPGAVNVIPAQASFTIDLRSPRDPTRFGALAQLKQTFAEIARRRGVGLTIEGFYDEAAATCAPAFRAGLARSIQRQGLSIMELPSGAGHDGLAMIHLCPIGMLFVRCAGGISHNPAESVTVTDVGVALAVLTDFLRTFDPAA